MTERRAQVLRTPAKINLGLRLMGRREDGYHLLESVFAPIELWDEIEVDVSPGRRKISLEVEMAPGLPPALSQVTADPDNLVVRAAQAFCEETGFEAEIRLRLKKEIPVGAGLGGGSSDAAAVLLCLVDLSGRDPGKKALEQLALGLGSDVPFFLAPTPSLVSGIGEQLEPVAGVAPLDLVLVNPGNSLATAEVYRAADALASALTEPKPGSTMRAISRLAGETGQPAAALGELLVNDLEPAARRLCPPVARVSERLREAGAVAVCMSGSGATVFGVFESADRANEAAKALLASHDLDRTKAASKAAEPRDAGAWWVRVTRVIPSH